MIEFDCEGCGLHVIGVARDAVPASRMCAMCEWLCEYVPDPVQMMTLRQQIRDRENAHGEGFRQGR